jgi:hypothetical protein
VVRHCRVQTTGSNLKHSIYAHLATRQICKLSSNSSQVLRSTSLLTDYMASQIHSLRSESFWQLVYTPHKKKPKLWRTGSASQMYHSDKLSADNATYLARPEQPEFKDSLSLNISCMSLIATLKTRKRFLRKNIYLLST